MFENSRETRGARGIHQQQRRDAVTLRREAVNFPHLLGCHDWNHAPMISEPRLDDVEA